jgi:4-alpha-glucanotransferase
MSQARHAGFMLPLFSATSADSWGIGELPDLLPLARWLASAGFDRLMILPVGVVTPGDTSPYASQSAMAIDPTYIGLAHVPDFEAAGGVGALGPGGRADLDVARGAEFVDYERVHRVKHEALAIAFDRFHREEWRQKSARALSFASFVSREWWWLDDWAVYAAAAGALGTSDWRAWPARLRDREPGAVDEVRRDLERELLRHQYLQWQADLQWQGARMLARAEGVTVFGDMPFMVSAGSADVWVRPDEFMFDVSLGVPPDAFSATGQDWGMPTYRWDRIAQTGFAWVKQRARRMDELYDGYRVDHLIGWFRTYGRPAQGEPFFNPADEPAQIAQGEAILQILLGGNAVVLAEDLGVVPPFARASMARLGVPGCKVIRWERDWHAPGHPFIDPAAYPALSAAMTGTHDTETMAGWWSGAGEDERRAAVALPPFAAAGLTDAAMPWSDALRDAWLAVAYQAGSNELFVPAQDVFGWTDRINVPGTFGGHNWAWRLPWRVDHLADVPEPRERAAFCRRLAKSARRGRVAKARTRRG